MTRYISMLLLIILVMGSTLLVSPAPSFACSCEEPLSVQEELEQKTAIFSGKVIDLLDRNTSYTRSSDDPIEVSFEVYEVWKGEVTKTVTITTALHSASCGYEFNPNQEYLVYSYGSMAELMTGLCERTTPLSTATEDLRSLGEGWKPLDVAQIPSSTDQDEHQRVTYYSWILGAIAFLGFVIMGRKIFSK